MTAVCRYQNISEGAVKKVITALFDYICYIIEEKSILRFDTECDITYKESFPGETGKNWK